MESEEGQHHKIPRKSLGFGGFFQIKLSFWDLYLSNHLFKCVQLFSIKEINVHFVISRKTLGTPKCTFTSCALCVFRKKDFRDDERSFDIGCCISVFYNLL